MPDSNLRSPLTIEELLRLKRAERPSPEFWSRFERELRQKQLAALLEHRPWWQTLPRLLSQRKVFVPLGTTAIVAFALVSARFYSPVQPVQIELKNPERVDSPSSLISPVASSPVASEYAAAVEPAVTVASRQNQSTAVMDTVPLSEHLPEHAAELTPWSAPLPAQSVSAKLIATNVGQLEREDPRLNQPLIANPVPVASTRLQRSGGAVAELASVSALASKRTRLLAQFSERQFAPEPQAPASVRERLTRHLSDTSFSEHYTRVGLKGDQVSLRF